MAERVSSLPATDGFGFGESTLCRFPVPLHRLGVVLRHATALFVHDAEVEPGFRISLLFQWIEEVKGGLVVPMIIGYTGILECSRDIREVVYPLPVS